MTTKTGKKIGRPSVYTPQIADSILRRMADGEDLVAICQQPGMPDRATVYRWMEARADFRDAYLRAREAMADWWFHEAMRLSLAALDAPELSNATRVAVDTIKWRCAKISRRYSDKHAVELTGPDGGPLQIEARRIDAGALDPDAREQLRAALAVALARSLPAPASAGDGAQGGVIEGAYTRADGADGEGEGEGA